MEESRPLPPPLLPVQPDPIILIIVVVVVIITIIIILIVVVIVARPILMALAHVLPTQMEV